jgi:hypothetical protein
VRQLVKLVTVELMMMAKSQDLLLGMASSHLLTSKLRALWWCLRCCAGGNTALSRKAGGNKGKRYGAGPATTDEALLSRLGEILGGNMKEDFMVVHLQEPCSFCRTHVHGNCLHK